MLCTYRQRYTVVLASDVEPELHGVLARKGQRLSLAWTGSLGAHPGPTIAEVERRLPNLLPVLKHVNDLRPLIAATQARPDWVISSNNEHWNDAVALRTGLRIVTPQDFVQRLTLPDL